MVEMAKRKPELPAPAVDLPVDAPSANAPVPWSDKTKAERLSELADMGMEQSHRILSIEFDPDDISPGNVKRMAIVSNHALAILGAQIKVDQERLKAARESTGSLEEFYQRGAEEAS
jgi:hypothetical protein